MADSCGPLVGMERMREKGREKRVSGGRGVREDYAAGASVVAPANSGLWPKLPGSAS